MTLVTGGRVDRPLIALLALPLFTLLLLASTSAELSGSRSWLTYRPLVVLGEWSFALYLVHKPVMLLTERWGWWHNSGVLDGALRFLAFLTLSTAVAAVAHHALEKPVERALRGLRVGYRRSPLEPGYRRPPELATGVPAPLGNAWRIRM